MYRAGRPPWDIGRAQPAFVELEERGIFGQRVLDAGCGTGELALFFASRGHEAWGIDGAETAIAAAKRKAAQRGLAATFAVHDALALSTLGRTFDAVTDCGLFHTFADAERLAYAKSVGSVLRSGGNLAILCFSEHEPGDWGPRRVTREEIHATFRRGWTERAIVASSFATHMGAPASAWLAQLVRD